MTQEERFNELLSCFRQLMQIVDFIREEVEAQSHIVLEYESIALGKLDDKLFKLERGIHD